MRTRTLWIALVVVLLGSFAVLLRQGRAIDRDKPPIPDRVVDAGGRDVFTGAEIRRGQEVWQRLGGQQLGSVWGHGAYVAPDWSADWLHREAVLILDAWACGEGGASYAALPEERAAALRARLQAMMRGGGYDRARGVVVLPPARAAAVEELAAHYGAVFRDGVAAYAIPPARSPAPPTAGPSRRSSSGRAGPRSPSARAPDRATR